MGLFTWIGDIINPIVDVVQDIIGGVFGVITDVTGIATENLRLVTNAVAAAYSYGATTVLSEAQTALAESAEVASILSDTVDDFQTTIIQELLTNESLTAETIYEIGADIGSTIVEASSDTWATIGLTMTDLLTKVEFWAGVLEFAAIEIMKGNILTPLLYFVENLGANIDISVWMTADTIDSYISSAIAPIKSIINDFNRVTASVLNSVKTVTDPAFKTISTFIAVTRKDIGAILNVYNDQLGELYKYVLTLTRTVTELKEGKYLQAVYDYLSMTDAKLAAEIKQTVKAVDAEILTMKSTINTVTTGTSTILRDVQKSTNVTLKTAEAIVAGLGLSGINAALLSVEETSNEFFGKVQKEIRRLREQTDAAFAVIRYPVLSFIKIMAQDDRTWGPYSPFYAGFTLRSLSRAMNPARKAVPKPSWMVKRK